MTNKEASLLFSLFDGIGPKTFQKLLQQFESSQRAYLDLNQANHKMAGMSENLYGKFDAYRKSVNLTDNLEKLHKAKVSLVTFEEKEYPETLKKLAAPPIALFCKGDIKLLKSNNTIGVVGARKITSYGKKVTEKITTELVNSGMVIVSGLAMGVDAAAHNAAIENNGKTMAVLGCGVDCCTPLENQMLYEKILDSDGLIISEYPLGAPPSKGSFPARNRIIAGLSLGVLITEAAEDSGSLITADEAKNLGRPVFAVPGDIHSQMSRGALKLLKEGAVLVSSGTDILETLQITASNKENKNRAHNFKLSNQEKKIIDKLTEEALTIDILSKKTQIPMIKLMVIVSSLEMRGIIENRYGEIFVKMDL